MNADRLLEHFDRISDAPDAVPRLRRFVLDLAIRGKLLTQDRNDEAGDALLDRIANQPTAHARKRTRRTSQPPEQAEQEPEPFAIPSSWRFTRLADIGELAPRNDAAPDSTSAFVPMAMISADFGVPASFEVRPWGQIRKGYTHVANGDVAVAKITPCFENGKATVFRNLPGGIGAATTELHVLRPILVDPNYILIFLKSPFFIANGISRMTGTAGQKRLPAAYFANTPFPLPPLAEQHRIVAKLAELMALCDRLEAAQAEREARRDRLVSASLARVTEPASQAPSSARTSARFHLDHFARLTTRPEHVKQLRKTILNLAVRGRLVPQDDTWQHKPLSELCSLITSGSRGWAAFYVKSGASFIRAQNIRFGMLRLDDLAYVAPPATAETLRCRLQKGDLLIVITGAGVTTPACVDLDLGEAYVSQHVALTRPTEASFSPWLLLCLMAMQGCRGQLIERAYGAGKPGLNLDNIRTLRVPLPPLAEQRRIVAKVAELMALCDQLEASLASDASNRARLLEVLLHEALEPAA